MWADFEYIRPSTLAEALRFLKDHGQETTMVAGGTDVILDLKTEALKPGYLLDISRLTELRHIATSDQGLCVGSGVTLSEIYASRTLSTLAPVLQKSALKFGSKQIRNVATIGGNVAHCSPCADTVPALIVHEAQAVLMSPEGVRTVPVETLAAEPYRNTLRPDEIIQHFVLKPATDGFCDFQKVGRRQELSIARINMAVMAKKDAAGKIAFIRLALGSCTPVPRRLREVEQFLAGKKAGAALFSEAGRLLSEHMVALSGQRASTSYKQKAVEGLLRQILSPLV